jgi:hypothetical protein
MKLTREQKEAKLREAAEEAIQALLRWDEENGRPTLTQMEDEILELRRQVGEKMLAVALEGQETGEPVEPPRCAQCGEARRNKGQKARVVESRVGGVKMERGYYYCARCKSGIFPLDEQLELGAGAWSEGLEREAVFLSAALSSYELAVTILRRVGQIDISQPSAWRSSQEAGKRFRRVEEEARARANALPEQWEPPSRAVVADQRMGVTMDGFSMNVRQEGWKEVKIGVVFDIGMSPMRDKETGEFVDVAQALHNRYVVHLGGPDAIGEKVWSEARRRGWEQAQETVVLGDGAAWIWNQASLHFGQSHQVVDWYHAKEHLVDAARWMKPEGTVAFTRWLNSRETLLYQGHADKIAEELEQQAQPGATPAEELRSAAGYFRTNHQRMNYIEMREEGWPRPEGTRSGTVESGAKQFKARFSGPGMRWSHTGAKNLLPIRAAVLSGRFDPIWADAKNLPQL